MRIVRRSKLWMHENWVDFASVGLFLSAKAKKHNKKNNTTIDTAKNRQAHKYSASLGHKHTNKG